MHLYRILSSLGWLLIGFAAFMLLPALFASMKGVPYEAFLFLASAAATLFFGVILSISGRGQPSEISRRAMCLLLLLSWFLLGIFAAIPFYLLLDLSLAQLWFETISALTTTGASVSERPQDFPESLRLWKALLQWLGGFMTIVMALSIITPMGIGGMALRRLREMGGEQVAFAKNQREAMRITAIPYLSLSLSCFFFLWIAGENAFNAAMMAFSTISTGAFDALDQTSSQSLLTSFILAIFLLVGAMNFGQHYESFSKNFRAYADPETRFFFFVFLSFFLIWAVYFLYTPEAGLGLHHAFILTASLLSTSGALPELYASAPLPILPVLFMILIGGMTLSTAGGIKIMRFALLFKRSGLELTRLSQPARIVSSQFKDTEVRFPLITEIWIAFMVIFVAIFSVTFFLSILEENFIQSFIFAVSALVNAGPVPELLLANSPNALSYTTFSTPSLTLLSLAMIAGRVEIVIIVGLIFSVFSKE